MFLRGVPPVPFKFLNSMAEAKSLANSADSFTLPGNSKMVSASIQQIINYS